MDGRGRRNRLLQWKQGRQDTFDLIAAGESVEDLKAIERRRDEARRRRRQQLWLRAQRRAAEDRLEAVGLPRDAWRSSGIVWDAIRDDGEPDPFERLTVGNSETRVGRWLLARSGTAAGDEAYYALGLAWLCDAATRNRRQGDLERQLVIGRLIEAFRANLLFPGRLKPALKRVGDETRRRGRERRSRAARAHGALGGKAGAGKPKSDHGILLRRARDLLGGGDTLAAVLEALRDDRIWERAVGAEDPPLDVYALQVEDDGGLRWETEAGEIMSASADAVRKAWGRLCRR